MVQKSCTGKITVFVQFTFVTLVLGQPRMLIEHLFQTLRVTGVERLNRTVKNFIQVERHDGMPNYTNGSPIMNIKTCIALLILLGAVVFVPSTSADTYATFQTTRYYSAIVATLWKSPKKIGRAHV